MFIDFLLKVFEENRQNEAIVWKGQTFSYNWLLERYKYWVDKIETNKIQKGSIVIVEADFSPNSVLLLLALISHSCVFVPITKSAESKRDEFIEIAQGEVLFNINENDLVSAGRCYEKAKKYNEASKLFEQINDREGVSRCSEMLGDIKKAIEFTGNPERKVILLMKIKNYWLKYQTMLKLK